MSVAAARATTAPRLVSERLLAALPLVTIYLWLSFLYGWEAWGHVTPWLHGDELEMTQLSRSIAETGEPARRGVPYPAHSLYPYVLAPVWWINDTGAAYFAAKYLNVLLMTSAVFPAYGLARMVVSKPWAYFAAIGTATIPALYYSSMLLEEPLAYPWATFCAFALAKALATRSRWWIAGAAVASLVAPLVREQLAMVPAAAILAAIALAATSSRARREYTRWPRWDRVGAVVLAIGAVIVVNAAISNESFAWLVSTRYYKDRMLENGLWAVGALTIGIGVLPVLAGLAAFVRPRGERWTPELRAVVAVCSSLLVAFTWYTAVKAAYISTVFSTLVVERNLIYAAPCLFVGTALFFERPRLRWWAVVASTGIALASVLLAYPYKMEFRIYFDAPGFSLLQAANRAYGWSPEHAREVVVGLTILSLLVVVLPRVLTAGTRVALAAAAVGVLAWSLAGQMSAASASNTFSEEVVRNIDKPLDWIDRKTGGASTVYLGQRLTDFNSLWQIEFWNRSIDHVWSVDGTAPGPGPTLTPDLVNPRTGAITPVDADYVVTDPGVELFGEITAEHEHVAAGTPTQWRLFKIERPLRFQNSTRGVFQDGWAGPRSDYSQFRTPGNEPGFAVVRVHRTGWGGLDRPGKVRIRVGTLVLGDDKQPALGRTTARCSFTINRLEDRTFWLATPRPPFHVRVDVTPPFVPNKLDANAFDTRELGAQVQFSFSPTATVPVELRGCAAGLRGSGR